MPHEIQIREQLDAVFSQYRGEYSDLIPLLQDVQEALGYIPREAMSAIAEFLNMAESAVYGVATFYAQFYLTRQGRHRVKVCRGTACHVRGSARIMEAVKKKLGIKPGETTADYEFSLERVACLGSCALSPVIVIDDRVHGGMTPTEAVQLIEKLRQQGDSAEKPKAAEQGRAE